MKGEARKYHGRMVRVAEVCGCETEGKIRKGMCTLCYEKSQAGTMTRGGKIKLPYYLISDPKRHVEQEPLYDVAHIPTIKRKYFN